MTVSIEQVDQGTQITFEGELTIYCVGELFDSLKRSELIRDASIIIDAKQVTECDTAGIQLLLWLKKMSRAQSHCRIANVSSALDSVIEKLNLQDLLAAS